MKRYLAYVMVSVLTFSLALTVWLLAWRTALEPLVLELPAALRPGSVWPRQSDASCAWYYYMGGPVSCHQGEFYFTYDPRSSVIEHTAWILPNQELTIGRLVLTWGQPVGIRQSGWLVSVYWPGRYVYVVGRSFMPDNWVDVVVWSTNDSADPWQGFRQAR
jgi:hypothetical protein